MAARPASGITADTDVNLDFLTKEEKEALLSKKMDMIRQRNRLINERHEMIEADRRKAEESGNAVKAVDSKTLPAEGVPTKPRGRGRGQGQGSHKEGNKPMKDRPKSHGDVSTYEPIVDVSDLGGPRMDSKNKGRGGQQFIDKDGASLSTPKNRRRPQQKQEGYTSGHARPNRCSDPPEDHRGKAKHQDGRPRGEKNPPPDPTFNPLSDWRREGSDKKDGGKKEGAEHKRHPRNYGGGADLSKVKDTMKTMREKEKERAHMSKPLELVMTGRERKNHQQWKQEREKYDNERIQRQMGEGGSWKREWDKDKVVLEYDDSPSTRKEPAKRPAGRIGSGRFDRGDREERPRAPNRDGKAGGPSQQHQSPQSGPANHQHLQQQAPPPQPHSPQSPPPPTQQVDGKPTRGKGRGRGRGRGRGSSQGSGVGGPGDKCPRPRTWSGGDDRLVECQKEMLLVKFDNTAGDNSVEVEYENGTPMSPTPSSRSSGSMPGRGPTGRTANQGGNSGAKGGKPQNSKQEKFSKSRVGSGRISNHHPPQESRGQGHPDQFVDADLDNVNHRHSYDGSKVRTSSHSQSHGDSEEWEDCTESSGIVEEDDLTDYNPNLQLECKLNPEAPEFLPTSPDFLKTPPGHVKVLNWQGSEGHSPRSPRSNLSQPSLSSLSPREEENGSSQESPYSSPGSSASNRAKKLREEVDAMPEPDEPMPPPFLLQGETTVGQQGMDNGDPSLHVAEDEDEDDRFEDSVEIAREEEDKTEKPQDALNPSTNLEASKNDPLASNEEELSKADALNSDPLMISNGHLEEDIVTSLQNPQTQERPAEAGMASELPDGDELSGATTASDSVTADAGSKEENATSASQEEVGSVKPDRNQEGEDLSPGPNQEPDPNSDHDPVISTDTSESNMDSKPTAEHSAASETATEP